MIVKDLLEQEIDIDVYDDVCEELAIAFCGPMKLTPAGTEKFSEVLSYGVRLNDDCAIINLDAADWKKRLRKAKEFFEAMAGYCSEENYNLWFGGN